MGAGRAVAPSVGLVGEGNHTMMMTIAATTVALAAAKEMRVIAAEAGGLTAMQAAVLMATAAFGKAPAIVVGAVLSDRHAVSAGSCETTSWEADLTPVVRPLTLPASGRCDHA